MHIEKRVEQCTFCEQGQSITVGNSGRVMAIEYTHATHNILNKTVAPPYSWFSIDVLV